MTESELMPESTRPWILLIDDDPEFIRILEVFLKKMGVRLEATSSMNDFAIAVKKGLPTVCLVDLNLNGLLAGFSLVKGLRNKFGSELPIIVISASDDQAAISKAIECGADDFITKPIDPQRFNAKMGRFVQLARSVAESADYQKPPGAGIECSLRFDVQIKSIDELGMRVISPHFICQGAPTRFAGKLMEQAFPHRKQVLAVALLCELQPDARYLVSYEFAELGADDQSSLRSFLTAKS